MNISKNQFVLSVLVTGILCNPTWASRAPQTIEVFTDSSAQVVNGAENITEYTIDRIDQLQQELSNNLPINPEHAKQIALQRFQHLDAQLNSELENAAKGLTQALQYGIDRYPAIVFDGVVVVYGVTDVKAATRFYQQWQGRADR